MNAGQLALFDDGVDLQVDPPANGNGHDNDVDLLEAIRQLVAEPDMTEDEIGAVVRDALDQLGWTLPEGPAEAPRCRCTRTLVLPPGSTCLWCGRRPAQSNERRPA